MQNKKSNRLNDIVRNKIAVEISMNPKKSHLEIAKFYGISRQLVTKISKEYGLQRTKSKNLNGSLTNKKKNPVNISKINDKFSKINYKCIEIVGNFSCI